jgi:hypothetical protein
MRRLWFPILLLAAAAALASVNVAVDAGRLEPARCVSGCVVRR